MERETFDSLRVIRRESASEAGCSEVCRTPGGGLLIRLRIREPACQKAYLSAGATAPVRLEQEVLEVLLPYRDGDRMAVWLAKKPTLGQRRDACLALVAQCVADPAAGCVAALAAREENLRFGPASAWLQLLPDWAAWPGGMGPGRAAEAVAGLCRQILTGGTGRARFSRDPPELQLFYARLAGGAYRSWSRLQQDLSALPDACAPWTDTVRSAARRLANRGERFARTAAVVVVALLAGAALLSLAGAYQDWRGEQAEPAWPGIVQIGDQRLTDE